MKEIQRIRNRIEQVYKLPDNNACRDEIRCLNIELKQTIRVQKLMVKDEIKFLEGFAENLILGKRKKGQHKYNKINIKERIKQLKKLGEEK